MNKTYTAEEFGNRPLKVYLEAYNGNTVTINHSRYPDMIFDLFARPRRVNLDDDTVEGIDEVPDDKRQRLKNFITALYAERVEGLINSREFIDKIMEAIHE